MLCVDGDAETCAEQASSMVQKTVIQSSNQRMSALDKVERLFHRFDTDGNGAIDKQEMLDTYKASQTHSPEKKADRVMQKFDADSNGQIDQAEALKQYPVE